MCLGVPGKVIRIQSGAEPLMGKVEFGGIVKDVCLDCVPEVRIGDYVIVHVGFAISRLDEREAGEVFRYLKELGELAELGAAPEGAAP